MDVIDVKAKVVTPPQQIASKAAPRVLLPTLF